MKASTGPFPRTTSQRLDTVLSSARSSLEASTPDQKGKQRLASTRKLEPVFLPSPKAIPYVKQEEISDDHSTPRPSQHLRDLRSWT